MLVLPVLLLLLGVGEALQGERASSRLEMNSTSANDPNLPRIAFCLAGGLRTLPQERVHESILKNLTGGGDLFLSLFTGYAAGWKSTLEQLTAEKMESLLTKLKPKNVVTLGEEGETPCNQVSQIYKQWNVWSECVGMIEQHEMRNNFKYDLVFRSRPDMTWQLQPDYLYKVAEKYQMTTTGQDIILTSEDQVQFFHRKHLEILRTFKNPKCPEMKHNCKTGNRVNATDTLPALPWTDDGSISPYCMTVQHYRLNGMQHIEAKDHTACVWSFSDCEDLEGGAKATFSSVYKLARPFSLERLANLGSKNMHKLLKWQANHQKMASDPLTGLNCAKVDSKYSCSTCIAGFGAKHEKGEALALIKKAALPLCRGVTSERLDVASRYGMIADTVPPNMTNCMKSLANELREDPAAFAKKATQKFSCIEAREWNKINSTIGNYIARIQFGFDFH